ncbi:pantoate--beta-alanine ligase [Leucobacter sp. HY1908]
MRIIRTIDELREASRGAASIGLVPTMGALHEGHLSLVRAARAANELVVVSVFVNPTQFNDPADLAAYPRTEARDAELAASAGADLVFAPEASEMYPEGHMTSVHVAGPLTDVLEGASRPGHFDGVATVVSKLLIAAGATRAYFGQKDAQQLLVVRRLVSDLRLPTEIVACPISRETDGLARSSRNVRLSAPDRSRALALPRALEAAAAALRAGETRAPELAGVVTGVLGDAGLVPEYVAIVDPSTLAERVTVDTPVLCAIAVRVGDVRLIDNELLAPSPTFA